MLFLIEVSSGEDLLSDKATTTKVCMYYYYYYYVLPMYNRILNTDESKKKGKV